MTWSDISLYYDRYYEPYTKLDLIPNSATMKKFNEFYKLVSISCI